MKRFLALTLATALVLSLVACGGNNTNDTPSNNNESIAPAANESQNTSAIPEESNDADTPVSPTPEVTKDVPVLPMGETISVDDKCEFGYYDSMSDYRSP